MGDRGDRGADDNVTPTINVETQVVTVAVEDDEGNKTGEFVKEIHAVFTRQLVEEYGLAMSFDAERFEPALVEPGGMAYAAALGAIREYEMQTYEMHTVGDGPRRHLPTKVDA